MRTDLPPFKSAETYHAEYDLWKPLCLLKIVDDDFNTRLCRSLVLTAE
ncbi:MAG: hypothetical protein HRT87_12440 [Legionellales bacterium]|nr:hypothetical protein [Legionellales bacterium]